MGMAAAITAAATPSRAAIAITAAAMPLRAAAITAAKKAFTAHSMTSITKRKAAVKNTARRIRRPIAMGKSIIWQAIIKRLPQANGPAPEEALARGLHINEERACPAKSRKETLDNGAAL